MCAFEICSDRKGDGEGEESELAWALLDLFEQQTFARLTMPGLQVICVLLQHSLLQRLDLS